MATGFARSLGRHFPVGYRLPATPVSKALDRKEFPRISSNLTSLTLVSSLPPAGRCPTVPPVVQRRRGASSSKRLRSSSACRAARCTTGFARAGSGRSGHVADRSASCWTRLRRCGARRPKGGPCGGPQCSSSPDDPTVPAALTLSREIRGECRRSACRSVRSRRGYWGFVFLPLTMTVQLRHSPTAAPVFDGCTLRTTSSPTWNCLLVQPSRIMTPGLFSSTA